MESSNNNWMVDLDEVSYSHLVELSQNLSKVEGMVKKLVKEYKPWAKICDLSQSSSNFASADQAWGDSTNSFKIENEESDVWPNWNLIENGAASNGKNNNPKSECIIRWDNDWNTQPDWSNTSSKYEKLPDWNTPNASGWGEGSWESGWEKSGSKESNQEKTDWEPIEKFDW